MDKKAVESLTSFGLTEYEAKVYLTLVLKGVQKASTLADMSDIPRPHVYSVIKLLHEKGLLIIIPEKVTKYQALPIDAVLNKLLEERMESIKSLESIGKELASLVRERGSPGEADDGEKVQLYSGRWAIVDLIHKMMGRATASCEIITNDRNFVLTAGAYEPDFVAMHKKGVQAHYMLPIEKDTLPMIDNLSRRATIRHLDSMDSLTAGSDVSDNTFLRVVVIDDAEVLFVRALPGGGDESAIWTSQKEMARMIRLMFSHMWLNAPDLETRKTEVETGRKPEHLTPLYGDAEMDRNMRMVLSRSKRELCCVMSSEQLVYNFNMLVTEIRAACARGVHVTMLVAIRSPASRGKSLGSVKGEIGDAVKALKTAGAEVRHPLDESLLLMALSEEEVTFNLLGESAITSTGGNIGVYTNHHDTVERIRDYFGKLWNNSIDATERLNEISMSINKEILKDGEEGLKKYFERINGMGMGHFSIASSDPDRKTIVIQCSDPKKERIAARNSASSNICESARGAFKSFGEFIYQGTKMTCDEIHCVSRGDEHCEFRLHPVDSDRAVTNDLLKFFESIKSDRSKEISHSEN